MAKFLIGETVICSITVKDSNADLQDAATSVHIKIDTGSPAFDTSVLGSTGMLNDGTGLYHYDFDSSPMLGGDYRITYTVVDGERISMERDEFSLE